MDVVFDSHAALSRQVDPGFDGDHGAEGERAGRAVLQALASDAEASVRLAAVQALNRFPTRESADAAQRAADNDSDQMVREEADRVAQAIRRALEKAEGAEAPPPPPPAPEAGDGK